MKMRRIQALVLVSAMMVLMTGCTPKYTEEDDPQKILATANKVYAKEKVSGSYVEYIYEFSDGESEQEIVETVFDRKAGVRQSVGMNENGTFYHSFETKEKDGYYSYYKDDANEKDWIRYKEKEEDGQEIAYERAEKGEVISFDKKYGYTDNVKYSNEGFDTYNGDKALKIHVEAEHSWNAETEITKEDLLKENGWTEEAITYVDGFAELMDEYIKVMSSGEAGIETYDIWIDVKTCRILEVQSENPQGAQEKDEIMGIFSDSAWKVSEVQSYLDEGMAPEEIREYLKESEEAMESVEDGEEYEDEYEDGGSYITTLKWTEVYLYGEDVSKLDKLPKKYKEITQEQYLNGEF